MRHILTILAALAILAAPAAAQTMKALMFSTNGTVVANTGTLTFTNSSVFPQINSPDLNADNMTVEGAIYFTGTLTNVSVTRANLGFSTNLNTLWTATNASNAFNALNLGLFPDEGGSLLGAAAALWDQIGQAPGLYISDGGPVFGGQGAGAWRTNLALGATNIVTFASLTIANTTATNGLLFIRRTNNEAFLGMANLIASNNTTISNETLFRVGVAEATNRSAQFGFRTVRTNNGGEGFATFSVFGYNALMMIGPSDRSRTNTATNAGIEADIWTITPTNRVMTLRDTNTGALTMHQDLGFGAGLTNTAPTNTNTPAVWLRVWVGTNSYRVPLYQ